MFLLSQLVNRGNLRSAGVSRFIAKPLRSYRFPSLASASSGRLLLRWSTILGYYPFDPGCFTKNLGFSDARLVTPSPLSSSMLSGTPGCRKPLAYSAISVSPAPTIKGSAHSQNVCFSGLRGRFRAYTLHLARLAYLLSQKIRYRAVDWTLPGKA